MNSRRRIFRVSSCIIFILILVIASMGLTAPPVYASPAELYFTEYIEGTGNNKALEIYNGTGADVDLAAGGYNIQMFFNGSSTAGLTIPLTGTVKNGDVYVVAPSSANRVILHQADQIDTSGAGWFDGNDAVALFKGSTMIDVIGQIGFNPGTEWGTGLCSTAENTLRRKANVTAGDANGYDMFDPSIQWKGLYTNMLNGLDNPYEVTPMVSCGDRWTVALRTDGRVVVTGDNWFLSPLSGWTDIVQIAISLNNAHHWVVGLKSDGTVVATGSNSYGTCNVTDWTGITQVAAGGYQTLGLTSDGRVYRAGWPYYGLPGSDGWTGIIQVAAGWLHSLGLRYDGKVWAAGDSSAGDALAVGGWSDINQVAANYHSVGLKSTGQVITAPGGDTGWSGITQVEAGYYRTVGLKSDGTTVSAGNNFSGAAEIAGWSDIIQLDSGYNHTLGLKRDGTITAAGNNSYGQINVGDWNLIIPDVRPKPLNNTVTTLEDANYYTFSATDFTFYDFDADSLTAVKITSLPLKGTLKLFNADVEVGQEISAADIGNLKFIYGGNESGTPYTNFGFKVNAGPSWGTGLSWSSSAATLTVNITPVNDPPSGTNKTITIPEDTTYTFTAANFGFSDPLDNPPNSFMEVKITTLPGEGTLTNNSEPVSAGDFITVSDINTGKLKFRPAADAYGTPYTSFTFQVRDNGGTDNGGIDLDPYPKAMTVNVTPVNDPPSGADNTVTALADTDYTFTVADFLFSDPDPGDSLRGVKFTTLPGAGTLKINGVTATTGQFILTNVISEGRVTFRAAAGASGTPYTTFTFQVQDTTTAFDPSPNTMTINVIQSDHVLTVTTNPSGIASATGTGTYSAGATVAVSAPGNIDIVSGESRYHFAGWTGDGVTFADAAAPSTTMTMPAGAATITANYVTQYYLTINTNPASIDSPAGAGWYRAGTTINFSVAADVDIEAGSARHHFTSWDGPDGVIADTSAPATTLTMPAAATTVTANYAAQYKLTFAQSGIEYTEDVIVTVDGVDKTLADLPFTTDWLTSGTSLTYAYASPVAEYYSLGSIKSGERYIWASTSGLSQALQGNTFSVTSAGTVTAAYNQQYLTIFDVVQVENYNIKADCTATILTVNGAAKTGSDLPFIVWTTAGDSLSYEFANVLYGASGTKYVWWRNLSTAALRERAANLTVNNSGRAIGAYCGSLVTVSPATRQYSDSVTFNFAVKLYPGTLTNVHFYIGTQDMGGATLNLADDGFTYAASLTAPLLETVSGQLAAGNKVVTAKLNNEDSVYNPTASLTITKEDADLTFNSANPVAVRVASDGGRNSAFTWQAKITQANDGYPGDLSLIRSADITLSFSPVGSGGGWSGRASAFNSETGIATFDIPADVLGVETYTGTVTLENSWFAATPEEDVLVVYDPSLGFTTGGGWFHWPEDGSALAGVKTNFGFTMKYNRKGANVQGSFLLIAHLSDGGLIRLKSNAINGLAIVNSTYPGIASFSGKCVYTRVDADGNILAESGNQEFTVYVKDMNEPGNGTDMFWFATKLTIAGEDAFSLDINGDNKVGEDEYVLIGGGNIVVPHTSGSAGGTEGGGGKKK